MFQINTLKLYKQFLFRFLDLKKMTHFDSNFVQIRGYIGPTSDTSAAKYALTADMVLIQRVHNTLARPSMERACWINPFFLRF